MPNYCAALNCTRKSTQSDIGFFRFPRDPARCKKWVENCRRVDLEEKTADQLNKCYRLCAQHFESSMVRRSSPYKTLLQDNAIPTIFDLRSPLNNPKSSRKKRIIEPMPIGRVQRWTVRPDFSQNSMVLYLDLKQIPDGGMQTGENDHLNETVKEEEILEED
ncbi:52 kDa repressor of the inhibitor of the protein kinase-like [Rhinatrema bivittatum]|uniref:52 kDa repressor of the inhibitor of the protein kinase-like n=1 Tax=Rhinatrema bivittatum TaxID=194408 RepID=UPI001128587D|nr:52 kDa repressor of the inhibitor of the protein kinase-like [Rhinatrema bivittatum]